MCAHVGNVGVEGQPGSLRVEQTAVLGHAVAGEGLAAGKHSELVKRFREAFCTPGLVFCLSTFVSLP